MLAPRKFMQKRKKVEVFKDDADEADQKNWRKMMNEIDEVGSAVSVLRTRRTKNQPLPKDLVLGTLVRFKQQKKWNIVAEVYFSLNVLHYAPKLQSRGSLSISSHSLRAGLVTFKTRYTSK